MSFAGQTNSVVGVMKPEVNAREQISKGISKKPLITLADLNAPTVNQPIDIKLQEDKEPAREKLKKVVQKTNKLITMSNYHLQFRIDEDSERLQVKLIDDESNKVIREIPPDSMLALSAKIKEIIGTFRKMVGVFVDVLA
ncbi:MAG: hypothetical protein CVU90_13320 [Firmicutes bacterium HGW-Firmicutes-15]|nr:MAG: hypothetical protein CVU90_13320 [Firmicutes bacterium HGW-Firmicutes-15]